MSEDILSVVRDICYVQWDPVDAVAPSHIIAFWSRLGDYRISDLDRLLWEEKKLFLHWTPIASIVLTEDYPIYSSLMRRYPESLSKTWGGNMRKAENFLAEHKDLWKRVLAELKKNGPMQANQFQDYGRSKSPDGWTSGSNVTNMLHHLLMMGEVMVVGHNGLQNIYGLSDKFLPKWVDKRELSEEEFEREAAQRALRAVGALTPREIHLYFPCGRYRNLTKTLQHLEEEGKIHRVHVEGLGRKGEQYVHDQDLRLLESIDSKDLEPRLTLLSPSTIYLGAERGGCSVLTIFMRIFCRRTNESLGRSSILSSAGTSSSAELTYVWTRRAGSSTFSQFTQRLVHRATKRPPRRSER